MACGGLTANAVHIVVTPPLKKDTLKPSLSELLSIDSKRQHGWSQCLSGRATYYREHMSNSEEKNPGTITALLDQIRAGEAGALDRLFNLVYPDLKRLANNILAHRAKGPNIPSVTTLVHDACTRLLDRDALDAQNRRHFFRLFCRAMEDEWVERARHDLAQKRQPKGVRESLTDLELGVVQTDVDFMHLRTALGDLALSDSEAAEVVALRFYCGATLEETAEIMGSSVAIVRRNWSYAKAWLHDRLSQLEL